MKNKKHLTNQPYFWIARDMDGTMFLYDQKPYFSIQNGWYNDGNGHAIELPKEGSNDVYDIERGECICLLPLLEKSSIILPTKDIEITFKL